MSGRTLTQDDFGEPGRIDASVSERVRGLVGSEILKIASDIRALVAAGRKVANLTVGDFDTDHFPIPDALREGIERALRDGETNYPPSNGILELREAVAEFVARRWGARYPVDSVLIASGARPILYAAYRTVLDPGDRVIYPVPSWNNNHYTWISSSESIVVPTRAEDGFMPTLDQLAPHLSSARLLALNSPLNPTGTVITEDQLRGIVEAIVEENRKRARQGRPALFLLHDQVYASLVFGDAQHFMPATLVPESAPWVIGLDGISKAFAATGLRVGWMLAAPRFTSRIKDLIGHIGAWAPRPEQVALARFLADHAAVDAYQEEMNRRVQQRLDGLYAGFSALKRRGYPVDCIAPQGAIYLSLRLDLVGCKVAGTALDGNEAIRKQLLDRAGLAVIPFQAFGLEQDSGWFRLSVGALSMEDVERTVASLEQFLDRIEDGSGARLVAARGVEPRT